MRGFKVEYVKKITIMFYILLHFGFRFDDFEFGNYISIPDWAKFM